MRSPTRVRGFKGLTHGIDYRSVLAESADVNAVVGADGKYRYVSSAVERLFGWQPAELEGRYEEEFVHPNDISSLHVARQKQAGDEFRSPPYRFLCADSSYRWTEMTSRSVRADGSTFVVTMRDITEQRVRAIGLERQALSDPLTGLANRTLLMDRLFQALRRLNRTAGLVAVLYLDIDKFKRVNDSLGHHAGDVLLQQMAKRLSRQVRPTDTIARLGGDEFVIVAEGMNDESDALEVANRIIEAAHTPFSLGEGDEEMHASVSIGISCTRDPRRGAEDLLGEADLALYQAKNRGRDRAEAFDEELRERVNVRVAIGKTLQRCLDEEVVDVEYQPIAELASGEIVGAEAFLRIKDPVHGPLEADAFLKVAEETGTLGMLEEQLLTAALSQAARWRTGVAQTGLSEVAVNIHSRNLPPNFPRSVLGLLDRHILAPAHLLLEVSEKVLSEGSESTLLELRTLTESGVRVGLDGFGRGYSPLGYLRDFPFDFVKIDSSFIADLEGGDYQREVVASFVRLAHALHMTVVADGVTTEEQVRVLRELACDRAEGPLYGGPGSPTELEDLACRAQRAADRSPLSLRELP